MIEAIAHLQIERFNKSDQQAAGQGFQPFERRQWEIF
jgi:hypothetical protein